jgi:outer membrane receptor protein involved in Fe transport
MFRDFVACRCGRQRILAIAIAFWPAAAIAGAIETPAVEVVGMSPVKGLEQPRNEIPANIQSLDARSLRERTERSLPELLGNRVPSVTVNEIQGNPFQADVNYRGFSASPLLGTPQGLSVYQDGVRINEPFGDTVNWDLIPRAAISAIDLIPGSNPLFGLNTLGGALSIHTKNGMTDSGAVLTAHAGSFGRRSIEAELGGKQGRHGIYLAGTAFRETGWRDFSPSKVDQMFGKLSHRSAALEIDLSYTHADTDLVGNGLLPESMLHARRESIFTKPDNTRNRLGLLALNAGYWLDDRARLSATLYHRRNRTLTLNGDANDDFEGSVNDGAGGANGGLGFDNETAANNRTRNTQRSWGGALQWSRLDDDNHVAFGATLDQSRSSFRQTVETGIFDADRGVTGGTGEILETQLAGRTRSWSLFATDTYKPWADLAITTSLRYNRSRVTTRDEVTLAAPNLDGDYVYSKLNPSLGATWSMTPAVSLYATAGQGNRAPSPIELGCADRANPCSLPNAMQADPFLKQVVTRTLEAGMRGHSGDLKWNAAVFTADNRDDILFVGTSTSRGYFTNFGRTRRQGAELGASGRFGPFDLRADYSYVKATYRSSACLLAENNSTRGRSPECTAGGQDDEVLVRAGHRLPGIPAHSLKFGAEIALGPDWRVDADFQAYSRQFARGNENNAHRAGVATDAVGNTRAFQGSGEVPGHAVLNLGARVRLDRRLEAFARLNNVFDKHYATAGALAENPFNAAGAFLANSDNWSRETYYAPGAPRSFFVGIRAALD